MRSRFLQVLSNVRAPGNPFSAGTSECLGFNMAVLSKAVVSFVGKTVVVLAFAKYLFGW